MTLSLTGAVTKEEKTTDTTPETLNRGWALFYFSGKFYKEANCEVSEFTYTRLSSAAYVLPAYLATDANCGNANVYLESCAKVENFEQVLIKDVWQKIE